FAGQARQAKTVAASVVAASSNLRGQTYQGSFIPPQPVQPVRAETHVSASGYATSYTGSLPGQAKHDLNPPRPGRHAAERKKTPSLFERITSAVTHRGNDDEVIGSDDQGGAATGTGGGMRITPRLADAPSQGRLNIDAPAAARPQSEDELDIPAFLRRQAN